MSEHRRGRGRPAGWAPENPRTERLHVGLTPDEKDAIKDGAEAAGETLSAFVRAAALKAARKASK